MNVKVHELSQFCYLFLKVQWYVQDYIASSGGGIHPKVFYVKKPFHDIMRLLNVKIILLSNGFNWLLRDWINTERVRRTREQHVRKSQSQMGLLVSWTESHRLQKSMKFTPSLQHYQLKMRNNLLNYIYKELVILRSTKHFILTQFRAQPII